MNWIDIFCLAVLGLFFILGLWGGLLKSIIRLAAWAGGGFGAYFAKDFLGDFLQTNFHLESTTLTLLCFILGFLIPFFAIFLLGKLLNHAVKASPLSGLNRLAGGAFGLVKGLLICGLVLAFLHILPLQGDLRKTRNDATSYAFFVSSLQLTDVDFSPEKIEESIKDKVSTEVQKTSETVSDRVSATVKETSGSVMNKAKASLSEKVDSLEAKGKRVISKDGDPEDGRTAREHGK